MSITLTFSSPNFPSSTIAPRYRAQYLKDGSWTGNAATGNPGGAPITVSTSRPGDPPVVFRFASMYPVSNGDGTYTTYYASTVKYKSMALSSDENHPTIYDDSTVAIECSDYTATPPSDFLYFIVPNSATVNPYLTFSSPNTFTLNVVDNTKYWDGTLEYSTDLTTWSTWAGTSAISSSQSGDVKYLYMRGTGNSVITGASAGNSVARWVFTGSDISIAGNISKLLDYQGTPTPANYAFMNMFGTMASGVSVTTIVDAQDLVLDIGAVDNCYAEMFSTCTSLVNAPTFTALTLGVRACLRMFSMCTSLINSPELPAITISEGSYNTMFYDCTSLVHAPTILPAMTLPTVTNPNAGCYTMMFNGCTSLIDVPELPATTLGIGCYYGLFYGCTSLTTPPLSLPATSVPDYAYQQMFEGCTNIKLSETQTGNYTKPFRIPAEGTGTSSVTNALTRMFAVTGGTFIGTPTINTTYYLYEEPQPTGGTILIGSSSLSKVLVGNQEVSKIILNGVTLYESGGA